jgi:hypothetical protein
MRFLHISQLPETFRVSVLRVDWADTFTVKNRAIIAATKPFIVNDFIVEYF